MVSHVMDVTASRWDSEERSFASTAPGWHHQIVVGPSSLFGSNGIRVTPAGDLWIAQSLGDRVSSWSPASERFRIVAGSRDGVSGPDDLAFDSAGNTYLSQPRDGRVSVMDPSGALRVLVDDAPEANGITVTPDDRVFVDECRSGGRLLEVSTDGSFKARVVASGIGMANALEMGPDGRLYLPEIETGRILAVDPDTGRTSVALEGVAVPSAVKFDPSGRLVVSEAATGELVAHDLGTGQRQVLASSDPGLDNFAFDGHGSVYISNFVTGAVVIAKPADGAQRVIHAPGLLGPCSLSLRRGESVLVGDWMSVAAIDADGTLHRVAQVPVEFTFSVIGAVEVGRSLVVLSSEGRVWRRGAGGGPFEPLAVGDGAASALCSTGTDAFVAAAGARVLRVDADGRLGEAGRSGLSSITAIAARGGARAVCDRAAGRVEVLDEAGQQSWSGFDDPRAVALTDNSVYVAEGAARRVLQIARASGERVVVATSMPFGSPAPGHSLRIGSPSLLAVDEDHLVVGCDGDGSIRRLLRLHGG
jgi:sugar lactone lactonase YvrE